MKAIVCSIKDIASMNMFEILKEKGFEQAGHMFQGLPVFRKDDIILARSKQDNIHPQGLDNLHVDEIVMATRHKSESGKPTLTVHPTGNFGPAEKKFGGKSHELSYTNANTMRNIFLEIRKSTLDYEVSLEVTHHGPTSFKTPLCFVELGSSEKQWKDKKAADFISDCILNGLKSDRKADEIVCAIGGGHYTPKFSDLEADKYAFGHICPKYSLDYLNEKIIKEMVEKTIPRPNRFVIDRKGTKQFSKVREMLKSLEVEVI